MTDPKTRTSRMGPGDRLVVHCYTRVKRRKDRLTSIIILTIDEMTGVPNSYTIDEAKAADMVTTLGELANTFKAGGKSSAKARAEAMFAKLEGTEAGSA